MQIHSFFSKNKYVIALFLLFLIGLVMIVPYGAYLDQDSEQKILYYNVVEYSNKLGINGPLSQMMKQQGVIPISESVDKDHGIAALYPIAWIYRIDQSSSYVANYVWHIYIYAICIIGYLCFFQFVKEFYTKPVALISTTLAFLTPRFFADMHYNNKDVVLFAIVFMIVFWGYKTKEKLNYKDIFLFAFTGALATNFKIIGACIFGMVGLAALLSLIVEKRKPKEYLLKMIICILAYGIFYFLLTPACWQNPLSFFEYVIDQSKHYRWYGNLLFNGKIITLPFSTFPRSYLPKMIIMTTPVLILLMSLVGGIVLGYRFFVKRKDTRECSNVIFLIGSLLGIFIPLLYAILARTPIYNGWRHFYFTYAGFCILFSAAIDWILGKCHLKVKGRELSYFAFGLYAVVLLVSDVVFHPFQYCYYNVLCRNNIENEYELDYWDMSVKQAFEYILDNNNNGIVVVGSCDNPTHWGLEMQYTAIQATEQDRIELTDNWANAQYVIVNPMYSLMYSYENYMILKEQFKCDKQIKAYGNIICEIYKLK